ncbi:hypothetical protein DYI24_22300 [Rhodopseudomonas sp. BR0C11]|nr:hypothetical protein [Rhodopseudomonas sp. BR0C11]
MESELVTMFRMAALAVGFGLMIGHAAQAQTHTQTRSLFGAQDARMEFIRQCTAHMTGRWAHPDSVCGCLHDHAAAKVSDSDLRQALLRGIRESGVPTIDNEWVPQTKQSQISATFTLIAKPALQCMFDPAD